MAFFYALQKKIKHYDTGCRLMWGDLLNKGVRDCCHGEMTSEPRPG